MEKPLYNEIYFLAYALYGIKQAKDRFNLYEKTHSFVNYWEYIMKLSFTLIAIDHLSDFNINLTAINREIKELDFAEKYAASLIREGENTIIDEFYDIEFLDSVFNSISSFLKNELCKRGFIKEISLIKDKNNLYNYVLGILLLANDPVLDQRKDFINFFINFSQAAKNL